MTTEKRLFLAILLSLLVIISWSSISSKFYPVAQQDVISKTPIESPLLLEQASQVAKEAPEESLFLNDQEYILLPTYAAIKEVVFSDYQDYRFNLGECLLWKQEGVEFKAERIGKSAYFTYQDQDKQLTKEIIFHNSGYTIELHIKIKNLKSEALNLNTALVLAKLDFKNNKSFAGRFQEVVVGRKDKIVRVSPRRNLPPKDEVEFISFRDRYFCAVIEPLADHGFKGYVNKLNSTESEIGLVYQDQLQPLAEKELHFLIYLGPQELRLLSDARPHWQSIVYYGVFDGISKFLLRALTAIQRITHNWGFALVLLSLSIYFALYPLTAKQMRSMKKMQDLQPKTEKLRQQYKNNPQQLNKEILELYRQEKINPFGGCLPLLLQLPIFFALYQALMRSLELKGAHFLWIKDLSEPDRLFIFPQQIPFLGNEFNLLPLLMMAMMFFQQKFMQGSNVGAGAEQQKMMGIIFPLMFGIIFYHMPSGLVLYWFINSSLTVVNQSRTKAKH